MSRYAVRLPPPSYFSNIYELILFPLVLLIYIYWDMVDLKCCVNFLCVRPSVLGILPVK